MSFLERVAGAPITWGVDGSPGWGHLMQRDRVMQEMADAGLHATELGPDGYLPLDPDEMADYVKGYGLVVVGGFVPAILYRPDDFAATAAVPIISQNQTDTETKPPAAITAVAVVVTRIMNTMRGLVSCT